MMIEHMSNQTDAEVDTFDCTIVVCNLNADKNRTQLSFDEMNGIGIHVYNLCKQCMRHKRAGLVIGGSAALWGFDLKWDKMVKKCQIIARECGVPCIDGSHYYERWSRDVGDVHALKTPEHHIEMCKFLCDTRNALYSVFPHGCYAKVEELSEHDAAAYRLASEPALGDILTLSAPKAATASSSPSAPFAAASPAAPPHSAPSLASKDVTTYDAPPSSAAPSLAPKDVTTWDAPPQSAAPSVAWDNVRTWEEHQARSRAVQQSVAPASPSKAGMLPTPTLPTYAQVARPTPMPTPTFVGPPMRHASQPMMQIWPPPQHGNAQKGVHTPKTCACS